MRWSLRVHGEELRIARPAAGDAQAESELPAAEAAFWVGGLAGEPGRDGIIRGQLLAILRTLDGGCGADRLRTTELRDRVAHALRTRRLHAFRTSRPISVEQPRKEEPLGPAGDETTWIEIELLDEDDLPIADERYRVEASDGRVFEGTTDHNGRAYVEGVTPGTCKVTFLGIDASSWKRAS
jgi:hypothetical protein